MNVNLTTKSKSTLKYIETLEFHENLVLRNNFA